MAKRKLKSDIEVVRAALIVEVVHDTDPGIPEQGRMYFHCRKCLAMMPEGTSPQLWARQQLASTDDGLQLWCTRCDCNIDLIRWREGE